MNAAPPRRRIAVVGAGWAGIAAAVEATGAGHMVTLYEMAGRPGGRARQIETADAPLAPALDNGQHILIGAYTETLRLIERVGVEATQAFVRLPLTLRYPDGEGLQLATGRPALAFARAVLARRGWTLAQRAALIAAVVHWRMRGFACPADWSVDRLVRRLPHAVRRDLIEPLCVAALNTPSAEASASTFLRVLHDALDGGPGSADLLLPRLRLGALLPEPAARWLQRAGAVIRCRCRVEALEPDATGWRIAGESFDAVVLATGADEAARLAAPVAAAWARQTETLVHEPIITAYLQIGERRLTRPMLLLRCGEGHGPAQFAFDLGQLGSRPGLLAFVISGARHWVDAGRAATQAAVIAQARTALVLEPDAAIHPVRLVSEKRATFRCTPGLVRPGAFVAPGLHAAGDYVSGPYPATLEGAVRSGIAAARSVE